MFFSLDQSVTKNQILKTTCQPMFFVIVTNRKEKRAECLFSFQFVTLTKHFYWHLVSSIWFLATGWSNEKNNKAVYSNYNNYIWALLITNWELGYFNKIHLAKVVYFSAHKKLITVVAWKYISNYNMNSFHQFFIHL